VENSQIGPFHILEKLGAHRRHNVYRARQVEQNREVALKFITLPPDVERESALLKINHEANVLKALDHPNLVKVFGAGCEGKHVFFAHEVIEGETLASLLLRRGRLAPDLVIDYARQIASALEYLHQNEIIHSKLTTDKLIVDGAGLVHISDLRLNRSRKRRWDAAKRASLETAAYMPPEQLLGQGATSKSDVYTLGVIMFEMLTGKLPYEPQTMAQLARDKQDARVPRVSDTVISCPGWLDKLVRKMMLPDPKRRPHSIRAVIMTLDQIHALEQNKVAAAEEMTRGFSALAAGSDRAEARRVMGMKQRERAPEKETSILQGIPFLAGALGLIAILVTVALIWTFAGNPADLMERANALLASSDADDWRDARKLYTRIMQNSRDENLRSAAEHGYFESRRKSMMRRLEGGVLPLEKAEIRELYAIMQNENAGKLRESMARYQRLADKIDPNDDLRYVRMEALERFGALQRLEQDSLVFRERYETLRAAAESASSTEDDRSAFAVIEAELQDRFGNNEFLADLVNGDNANPDGALTETAADRPDDPAKSDFGK
jgi:serine/threonine-protein kinase